MKFLKWWVKIGYSKENIVFAFRLQTDLDFRKCFENYSS